jgi:hypothetical protein
VPELLIIHVGMRGVDAADAGDFSGHFLLHRNRRKVHLAVVEFIFH